MNYIELEKIKQKALEDHIPIIMDDTLEVIEKYLKNEKPTRMLEIGTAVGYSAICFSEFLAENGEIDTIERETDRVKEAKENMVRYVEEFIPNKENHEKYNFLFKKVYIGNNCVIKNSIILNDVHIGDNCYIENCIVESRDTLRANTVHTGDPNEIKVIVEKNFRYAL